MQPKEVALLVGGVVGALALLWLLFACVPVRKGSQRSFVGTLLSVTFPCPRCFRRAAGGVRVRAGQVLPRRHRSAHGMGIDFIWFYFIFILSIPVGSFPPI